MKKLLLGLAILISIVGIVDFYRAYKNPSYAQSFGSLTVNFHSSLPGNAIFDITNFLPGDTVTKTVDVKNEGKNTAEVFVRGIKTQGTPGNPKIENVLDLEIKQGSSVKYSGKLNTFFQMSQLSLGTQNKNQSKEYSFKISFPTEAGNEYQDRFVKFNLEFKSSGDVKGDDDDHDWGGHHKKDFRDKLRDFGNKCKSAFEQIFKFRKR